MNPAPAMATEDAAAQSEQHPSIQEEVLRPKIYDGYLYAEVTTPKGKLNMRKKMQEKVHL